MTEASLRRWLTKLLKNQRINLQPIESGGTGVGIPDLYFRTDKHSGWIEFKIGKLNKEDEIKLRWEPGQLNWIKDYAELGDKIFLFVGVNPNMLMVSRLGMDCTQYKYVDTLLESIHYACELKFISREKIMKLLNTL